MSIPFTQYLMPNGRKVEITIDRPEDIEKMAAALIKKRMVFSIEVLSTGEIAMYCEKAGNEDIAPFIRICNNGPEVLENVDELIRKAYQDKVKA